MVLRIQQLTFGTPKIKYVRKYFSRIRWGIRRSIRLQNVNHS